MVTMREDFIAALRKDGQEILDNDDPALVTFRVAADTVNVDESRARGLTAGRIPPLSTLGPRRGGDLDLTLTVDYANPNRFELIAELPVIGASQPDLLEFAEATTEQIINLIGVDEPLNCRVHVDSSGATYVVVDGALDEIVKGGDPNDPRFITASIAPVAHHAVPFICVATRILNQHCIYQWGDQWWSRRLAQDDRPTEAHSENL